jgi:hypothetical protein
LEALSLLGSGFLSVDSPSSPLLDVVCSIFDSSAAVDVDGGMVSDVFRSADMEADEGRLSVSDRVASGERARGLGVISEASSKVSYTFEVSRWSATAAMRLRICPYPFFVAFVV